MQVWIDASSQAMMKDDVTGKQWTEETIPRAQR